MTQLVPAAAFERGARLIDLPPDTETSPEADQAAGTEPRRRRRPHMVVLALGGAGIVVHQLLPARWHELSYDSIEIYILLAMIWGIRRHRPRPGRPWWLLTAGIALLVVGDVIYNALTRITGAEVFPSVADGLYIASYLVLSAGVISLLRLRRHRGDRTAIVDALLVTVASAAITWVYLIAPGDYVGVRLLDGLVSAAYPVGDLVLLAFLVRLLISPGKRAPSERILALGISLLLVADVAYARLALSEAYTVGSWLDAVYHSSYLCFAVAAAHPTMRTLSDPDPGYSEEKRSRLWLLACISLALPILAGIQMAAGHQRNALVLATASGAAFFLLTFRTGVLNSTLAATLNREEDALRRERILRNLGTVLVTTQDRRAIFAASVDHARRLAGDGADALFLFAGEGAALVATASDRRSLPEAGLVLERGLSADVERRLLEGRTVVAGPDEEDELRALLPAVFIERPLFVAPVFAGGRLRGALVVVPADAGDQPDRLAAACEAVASAVSLALEAAELAERLVDERSEQRFGAMIRNSSDIVLVLRADGTVRFLSPSVTRVLGWAVEDLLGRHITGLVHPDDAGVVTAALETALSTPGTHGPFQCRYHHRDGSWRYLEAIGMSRIDDPAVGGIILNVRDVTERVRLAESLKAGEERLASQVAELQELHRVKNDFVATISHELRTPLTSILGQLELLGDGDYGALVGDQVKAVASVDRNSHRLLVLIEDLLTVARIESARLQLRRAPTDLAAFVEGVHASLVPVAKARSVTLHFEVDPAVGTAEIDALQMERALINLLTNAVKFTLPEGRVEFLVRRTGDAVVFTVSDDGIGIPLEEQDQLFTRFFRSTLATNLAVQGSGLGLVITKSIVEEHGGTIELTSTEAQGTTVVVTLPVSAGTVLQARAPSNVMLSSGSRR